MESQIEINPKMEKILEIKVRKDEGLEGVGSFILLGISHKRITH